jgi:hypothetical protein
MARAPKEPTPGEAAAAGVALSGTLPPAEENGLAVIREGLLDQPRTRRYAVVEVINARTVTDHPADLPDAAAPVVRFMSIEPITDPADVDQLQAMRDRARTARTGQSTLEVSR